MGKLNGRLCVRLCEFGFCHCAVLSNPRRPSSINRFCDCCSNGTVIVPFALDHEGPASSEDTANTESVMALCFATQEAEPHQQILGHLSLAASLCSSMVGPMRLNFSCASLAAISSPKVFLSPVAQSILPHWRRLPDSVPGRPPVLRQESYRRPEEHRCDVESSSIPGQTHSFNGDVLKSVLSLQTWASKNRQSHRVLVRTKPRLQEGERKQSKDKALFKTMATSFQLERV